MIKNAVRRIMNKLFSVQTRMVGILIVVFSVSACGDTVAIIPMWDEHPANPMVAQAFLPPQSDTLKSEPVKPSEPKMKMKMKMKEHQHGHH